MEEAYNELYQQFLCLRSLCLKQAALLHQLTTALQKQQGAPVLNGEVSDLMSIPVQCSHDIPPSLYEKPQPLKAAGPDSAEPRRADRHSRNAETASGLLAEGMSKLCVDIPCQRKQDVKMEKINPFPWAPDSSGYLGASSSKLKSGQTHPDEDRSQYTARMPVTDCALQVSGLFNQDGGAMMSDVALQSHMCEFCQAVFPGHSTTKGEFLRHLHTHIT